MSDTPETDEASQSWLRIHTNGETFIDENRIVLADKMAAMEIQRNEALQLARELRDALVNIEEYWNRNQNEVAMADACWHAIHTSQEAIEKANQLLK